MKLWPSRAERRAAAAARSPAVRRARILIWASLISIALGMVRFGDPLEAIPHAIRDTIRSHPANGKVVVVAKDDASAAVLGNWPMPRRYDAKVIDNLFAAGAKRVFFDEVFGYPTNAADDNLLGATMAKYPGRVFVGVRANVNRVTSKRKFLFPIKPVRDHAELMSIIGYFNVLGIKPLFPDETVIDGKKYPHFFRVLSSQPVKTAGWVTPDMSIQLTSAPTVSYASAWRNDNHIASVHGKDVLVSPVSDVLSDIHYTFPQGNVPGSYVVLATAETVSHRNQIDLGWVPMYIVGWLISCILLYARRRSERTLILIVGVVTLSVVPFILDVLNIRVDLFPSALLLSIISIRHGSLRRGLGDESTNSTSGLPNLKNLQENLIDTSAVVALKIRNFGEIVASLDRGGEVRLIGEVLSRLRVATSDVTIYHSNDSLLWQSAGNSALLTDHLDGLHALFNVPAQVAERSVDISIAFGIDIEFGQKAATRVATALALADEAAAKGSRWKQSDAARHIDSEWRLSLLGRMETALSNGEIWVAYQPQLDLVENQVLSAEALVRWTHPERGAIRPDEFVLAAEQGNRIDRLTYFVMERAIADAAAINRRGSRFAVSVNLSAKLLGDRRLIANIERTLTQNCLPPELLTIEVTESSEIERPVDANAVMRELRLRGINVSIDDYGTGFSTLEYLKSVPANEVKIDRQFVAAIMGDGADRILVDSTIALAHSLGQRVVAEGVESNDVLERLRDMGCDAVQGYLISHPIRLVELTNLVENRPKERRAN